MFVFEIITPGTWLDHEDREWSSNMEGRLQALRTRFFEANAALNLFIKSRSGAPSQVSRVNMEIDSKLRSEIQEAMEREYEEALTEVKLDEIKFEAEVHLKREKWKKGVVPWEFEHRLPLVYARTFLHAVDGFASVLEHLAKEADAPHSLMKLRGEMAERFPHLAELCCNSENIIDVGGGQNPDNKTQSRWTAPANKGVSHLSRGGSASREYLNGLRYGMTMADGQNGEIEISPESMHHLQEILEGVLHSFRWRGPKQHEPGA